MDVRWCPNPDPWNGVTIKIKEEITLGVPVGWVRWVYRDD